MVLVVCKTCRNSRLFHALAAGLVWRGDDAGHEIIRVRRYRRREAYCLGSSIPGNGLPRTCDKTNCVITAEGVVDA